MRWEDQELNHDVPETKFPEVFFAGLFLLGCASKQRGRFLRIDRQKLDELVGIGELPQKAAGARIDRLCLHYRLACRLGPGGDHYPTLGTTHFWEHSESLYAILHISPQNDWFHIMVIGGESPNNPAAPNAGIASQLTGGHRRPGVGEPERSMTMEALHILPLICLLWACSNSMSRGLAAEYYHVWKLNAAYEKPIPDPEQWAADNFSDAPNAAKDDWKIERFELDLNHDGVPEVFLTTPRLHGTGGGPHLVFQKRREFYFYGGQISGRKHTIRVLPVEADGRPRIMTVWSDGGGRGTVSVWKWDGKAFQAISSEAIGASDSGTEEGRRRFEELVGKKGLEPSGAAVAPSIYGPAVLGTEFDSERPLDLSLIPAMVAIRVAPSVQESLALPSLPTDQLPRVVHRPEFLIDGRVQSLPK